MSSQREDRTDYGYKYDDFLDSDLAAVNRPIITINNNYGRRQTVREILEQAAEKNPYLRVVLRGMYK